MKYISLSEIDWKQLESEVQEFWKKEDIFMRSQSSKSPGSDKEKESFVFYEGPPSANGIPGIHHIMGRSIKDAFCRYKTMQGYSVVRHAGWDTHGLPVELQVEKDLGIQKSDIGKTISVEDYNKKCREAVMRFRKEWENLTHQMGFWINMEKPYLTCDKNYIETVWWLVQTLYNKGLLYRGKTIQPYSPAAGTALSQHELNQPGCYKSVKDISIIVQFQRKEKHNEYLLAWTTTPWTLSSNQALAVHKDIPYLRVKTQNPYTQKDIQVYLAESTLPGLFSSVQDYEIIEKIQGKDMVGWEYEPLFSYVPIPKPSFLIVEDDFVSTEEGTGIVHIAPTFGADDARIGKKYGLSGVYVKDDQGEQIPLVDKMGRFVEEVKDFAGRYVKDFGFSEPEKESTDLSIALHLKKQGKAFKIEKHNHSYPHCWRTDKPILYYPVTSWFLKTTQLKKELSQLNKEIHWHPPQVGKGRFGNWLENLQDWNLSRTRFWGSPLPIWMTEDQQEILCIGSYEELKQEVHKSVQAGWQAQELPHDFDPHRPYVDELILCSPKGKPMYREQEVLDVWFDSGAMPYAQWHYPFENSESFEKNFPADFIAEGIDQTRGWFFTLHALSSLLWKKISFKNVVVNGLVLDKKGNKMSKRWGNTVDPLETLKTYGADPTRWYLMGQVSPGENVKFDAEQLHIVQRSFFGTLQHVFNFFMLYAEIDAFYYSRSQTLPVDEREIIDQWLISRLQRLIAEVTRAYENYLIHQVIQQIQSFVLDDLSNWYIRLNRKRFWQGQKNEYKYAAYQSLYECLKALTAIMAPIAPFLTEKMYDALRSPEDAPSVHLIPFPKANNTWVQEDLNKNMRLVQKICSLGHALRKKHQIKVRQPLSALSVPASDPIYNPLFENKALSELILSELNVKEIRREPHVQQVVKPHFQQIGKGPHRKWMKDIKAYLESHPSAPNPEKGIHIPIPKQKKNLFLPPEELIIHTLFPPGHQHISEANLSVALDFRLSSDLLKEGWAREFVNRIQHLRKKQNLDVDDKIHLYIQEHPQIASVWTSMEEYIRRETQALKYSFEKELENPFCLDIEKTRVSVRIEKLSP
ncbi:MAG: isoleucine--tRNA ligase [Cytophagales bacterium]|nr:isoleucine--tRNA ligase [Cytophagales bacterium]